MAIRSHQEGLERHDKRHTHVKSRSRTLYRKRRTSAEAQKPGGQDPFPPSLSVWTKFRQGGRRTATFITTPSCGSFNLAISGPTRWASTPMCTPTLPTSLTYSMSESPPPRPITATTPPRGLCVGSPHPAADCLNNLRQKVPRVRPGQPVLRRYLRRSTTLSARPWSHRT